MAQNQRRMLGGYGEYSTLVPIRNQSEYDNKRFPQLITIKNLLLNIYNVELKRMVRVRDKP